MALLALGVGLFYVLARRVPVVGGVAAQGTVYRSSAVAAERLLARYFRRRYLFHAKRRIGVPDRADDARLRHRLRIGRRIGRQPFWPRR